MTETELRQKVVDTASSWLGDARVQRQASGDAGHLQRPAPAAARHADALVVAVVHSNHRRMA